MPGLPKSPATEAALPLRLALWALFSALFTLAVVHYSLRHGRLLLYPTYDDISYLSDGLQRLEVLYHDGWSGLWREQFSRWPHSPFSTYLAMASFALLGVHDWAPYAGNAVIVFALLVFVDHLFRGLPLAWRVAGALFALSIPVASVAVFEYRPDMACGVVTAMGVVLLLEVPLEVASTARRRAAGACFGLALLFKPSIAALTIPLFALSVGIALIASGRFRVLLHPREVGRLVRSVLGPATLIGIWPFVFEGPYYVAYFRLALFSRQKPIADFNGSWRDQMKYYVLGAGGDTVLGAHVVLLAVVIALGGVYLWRAGDRETVFRVRDQLAPLAVAYALPTLNPVKQPFFGVTFAFLLVFLALQVLAAVLRMARRSPRSRIWALPALAAVVLAGLGSAKAPTSWGDASEWRFRRGNALATEISSAIEKLNLSKDSTVFVTATGGISADLLRYRLLKIGATRLRLFTIPFEENTGDVAPFHPWFGRADAVLASEPGNADVYTSLPNGFIQDRVLAALSARPDYVERRRFAPLSDGGGRYVLFERIGPFFGWTAIEGLLPEEGPYPEWSLPRVRWGTGPRSVIAVDDPTGVRSLVLVARANAPGTTMTVTMGGAEVARHTFGGTDRFDRLDVPVGGLVNGQRIEIRYTTWDRSDPKARAVLFRKLKLLPAAMPEETEPPQDPAASPDGPGSRRR